MTIATTFDQGKKSEKVVLFKAGEDYYAIRPDDTGAAKLPMMGVEDIIKRWTPPSRTNESSNPHPTPGVEGASSPSPELNLSPTPWERGLGVRGLGSAATARAAH